MRIMDGYLLRHFLQVFVICFISFTGLFIVIDAFGHMDEFMAHSKSQGGLLAALSEYYAYRSLVVFDRTSGILALTSAMFTVSWVQRHNELTALLAAGIAKGRVVVPILLSAVAVSLLAATSRELLIPIVRHELSRDSRDLAGEKGHGVQPRSDRETDIIVNGHQTVAKMQKILGPDFWLPPELNQYGNHLVAKEAYYKQEQDGRPSGYLLVDVSKPPDLANQPSLYLGGRPVVITPRDAKWLKPNECFVASNVSFEVLEGSEGWRLSSTSQLIRGLDNPSVAFRADVRVAIHNRLVQPLLDTTLLFLGLPLVLSQTKRNMFLAIGLCILVVICFMCVTIASQYLGSNSLIRPALAAWLPLFVFVPVAVGMVDPLFE